VTRADLLTLSRWARQIALKTTDRAKRKYWFARAKIYRNLAKGAK
jgi:hypothetical protein